MGLPVAERLASAGHEVTVWNRTADLGGSTGSNGRSRDGTIGRRGPGGGHHDAERLRWGPQGPRSRVRQRSAVCRWRSAHLRRRRSAGSAVKLVGNAAII
ncbi:hypothetical protein HUT10_47825 [Amycolatopsis sp. Hca4]|nr:hypothetical protein HUT10_47825 [Amycolatopsis sp. Hca4]